MDEEIADPEERARETGVDLEAAERKESVRTARDAEVAGAMDRVTSMLVGTMVRRGVDWRALTVQEAADYCRWHLRAELRARGRTWTEEMESQWVHHGPLDVAFKLAWGRYILKNILKKGG